MIYGLYVVKDEKVGFLQLMQDTNDATALRNFAYSMSKTDSLFSVNKGDFSLFKVGTFDSVTGEVVLEPTLSLIASGDSV